MKTLITIITLATSLNLIATPSNRDQSDSKCSLNNNGLRLCLGDKLIAIKPILKGKLINLKLINFDGKELLAKIEKGNQNFQLSMDTVGLPLESIEVPKYSVNMDYLGKVKIKQGSSVRFNISRPTKDPNLVANFKGKSKVIELINAGEGYKFLVLEKVGLVDISEVRIMTDYHSI